MPNIIRKVGVINRIGAEAGPSEFFYPIEILELGEGEKNDFFEQIQFIKNNYDEFATQKSLEQLELAKAGLELRKEQVVAEFEDEKLKRQSWSKVKQFFNENNTRFELGFSASVFEIEQKMEISFYKEKINKFYAENLMLAFSLPNKLELLSNNIEKAAYEKLGEMFTNIKANSLPETYNKREFRHFGGLR